MKSIIVDGQPTTEEELRKLKESATKEGKLLKEVSPGVWRTMSKLKG